MDRKNLWIVGGLIGSVIFAFIIVSIGFIFISVGSDLVSEIINPFPEYNMENASFNNSTAESTAASIAKLNFGVYYAEVSVTDVYLTDDGKYWIVGIDPNDAGSDLEVTIDAKTLMSKRNDDGGEGWRSLDQLKASYIADIQTNGPESIYSNGKPQKITMGGKEIWKVSTHYTNGDGLEHVAYIYVDLVTGKSKSTLPSFNRAAGTDGWLTLKEVDAVINMGNKGNYQSNYLVDLGPGPFRDVLRDLYPE